ncbi:hypothetical protein GCM10018772_24170 [Streptomyces fumanus]|uniref:Uncharacterized protein n=1 Tax=Streptomyces fumanus TaxID=67302 RepID=A0A919E0R6_9ACTN|nr:hypothetical protein GCM10018772_24170 [Streptomyces fumanus]
MTSAIAASIPRTRPDRSALQGYAACDPAGRDLQLLVSLVGTHGVDEADEAVPRLGAAPRAQDGVSTVDKARRVWRRSSSPPTSSAPSTPIQSSRNCQISPSALFRVHVGLGGRT